MFEDERVILIVDLSIFKHPIEIADEILFTLVLGEPVRHGTVVLSRHSSYLSLIDLLLDHGHVDRIFDGLVIIWIFTSRW